MKVPLHFSGAEESPAVKVDKCMVNPVVNELDVTCMPSDLPGSSLWTCPEAGKGRLPAPEGHQTAQGGVSAVIRGNKQNPVLVSVVASSGCGGNPADAAPAADAKGKGKGQEVIRRSPRLLLYGPPGPTSSRGWPSHSPTSRGQALQPSHHR